MSKQTLIESTKQAMNNLPNDKAEEVARFAELLLKRYEEYLLSTGMVQMAAENKLYAFLNNEEDLYTLEDLKEVYNN